MRRDPLPWCGPRSVGACELRFYGARACKLKEELRDPCHFIVLTVTVGSAGAPLFVSGSYDRVRDKNVRSDVFLRGLCSLRGFHLGQISGLQVRCPLRSFLPVTSLARIVPSASLPVVRSQVRIFSCVRLPKKAYPVLIASRIWAGASNEYNHVLSVFS